MSENFLDKSDKELDEFLKKISDAAEIPFSEEDWAAMKSRLDESEKPKPIVWKRNAPLGLLVLLLAGMIAYFAWDQEGGIPLEKNQSLLAEPEQSPSIAKERVASEEPTRAEEEILYTIEATIQKEEITNQKTAYNTATSVYLWSQKKNKTEENSIKTSEKPTTDPSLTLASGGFLKNLETSQEESDIKEEPIIDSTELEINSKNLSSKTLSDYEEKENKKNVHFGGKFNVSFQVAPDLSAIQLDHFGKAGNMVGLGAEYFILPQVSISSGVFYSYKPYSGESGYHLNYGKTPSYVIGVCDILDIPLNLRFYAFEGKVQRFFISTGLSSYLMLQEKYELEYYNQDTGEPYFRNINVQGANQHYFGIVNVSVGYERKLGRQLGIQVEPYFKVPFSGVGEGDVSLKSTGIFVGLKYYPGKR